MSTPQASVVIPTYNRKDDLRNAIRSSLTQTIVPEIIILDDGSTDGTDVMMKQEFPNIRYERYNGPNGPSLLRTLGGQMATGRILFPIDDDAVFQSPHTIEQTLAEFDHPRVGAVGIPFINVRTDKKLQQMAPGANQVYMTSAFVGASHALRRDLFLKVGGFRKELFYMGEEGDLCIRFLNRGYITRVGRADPIHHFESPKRSHRRADLYGRRNDILFGWQNVPLLSLPLFWARGAIGGLAHGIRVKRPFRMIQGTFWGFGSTIRYIATRSAVRRDVYKLFLRLKRTGILPLKDVESILPAVDAQLKN